MFTRLFVAFCVLTSAAFAGDSYEIRFVRPVKAGDRFDVSAKVALEEDISTTFDEAPVEDNKTVAACRLTGELSVVAVTSKGLPKELRVKIETVECVEDGKPSDFFHVGDVLHLKSDEPDNLVQVNGEAAEDVQAQVIESMLSVQKEGEVTDDDIFGISEKVTVGREWPVSPKAAVADMARDGVKGLQPDGVKGHTKVVQLTTFENRPALLLRMEATIDGKDVSLSSLPPNVKGTRFHTEYSEEMDMPVDLTATGGHSKGMAKMEVDASGKAERGGAEVRLGVKIRRRVATELTATPAK